MRRTWNAIRDFVACDEGPTATEYAVMLALIIVVALGAVAALGTKVSSTFAYAESQMPSGSGS